MSTSGGGASAEEVAAVIAGTAPKGFRFAVTKAADEQAPPGVDEQIYESARQGKLDELLGLCQEWAGHEVIDATDDFHGTNALFFTAIHGHEECIRVLIAANADVAFVDRRERTALHFAVINGYASICKILIEEGASITAVNEEGETPLELAKIYEHAECVAVLEAAAAAAAVP